MEIELIKTDTPTYCNIILGQTHFIKSVEDIYDAIANNAVGIRFGVAFCEASGDCLVRVEGNDLNHVKSVAEHALNIGCGHIFLLYLKAPSSSTSLHS